MTRALYALWIAALATACHPEPPGEQERAEEVEPVAVPEPGAGVVTLREGFAFPESAVHDPEQDVYFVSNINGPPMAKDDNGYITRIDAGTGEIVPRWIDGTREDVTLNGPRGLSLGGDLLWAVDVDTVRFFDRRTGEPLGEVAVPDSLFLNDAFALPDGTVYVSDSGMAGKTEGPPPTPVDAVFRIGPDRRVEKIASGQDLHRPDGLWVHEGELWVTAFGSDELYRLADGAKAAVHKLPARVLDGLVVLEDGTFLVTSWDGNGVYRGRPGGRFERVIGGIDSPADIGFDAKRRLVLVPHLEEGFVSLHPLPPEDGGGRPR